MKYTDFRIGVRRFFKRNKNKILIIVIAWTIVIIINNILRNYEPPAELRLTYQPHTTVMEYSKKVPKDLQEPIEKYIDEYIQYLNKAEYDKAYNMIEEDCKKNMFPTLYSYKQYVNKIFDQYKRYSIQAYSVFDGMYIYQVKIFNDFLASGLTNEEYTYFEEKFVIRENEDGSIRLSVGNYITTEKIQSIVDEDDIKIDIKQRVMQYDREIYTVKITNKSEYILVAADNNEHHEIAIGLGNAETRTREDVNNHVILKPGESKEYEFTFFKYYDDNSTTNKMIFSAIRFLEEYSGNPENAQKEIENAVNKYSLTVEF